jgi:hypothetical protein
MTSCLLLIFSIMIPVYCDGRTVFVANNHFPRVVDLSLERNQPLHMVCALDFTSCDPYFESYIVE